MSGLPRRFASLVLSLFFRTAPSHLSGEDGQHRGRLTSANGPATRKTFFKAVGHYPPPGGVSLDFVCREVHHGAT
jgi:hypothetical protein